MRLLIIGNLEKHLSNISLIAINYGATIKHFIEIEQAVSILNSPNQQADIILIGLQNNFIYLFEQLALHNIKIPVIVCGKKDTLELATEAIKLGAIDYLLLPIEERLLISIFNSVQLKPDLIIGNSKAINQVTNLARKIANSKINILITGESGTGKEVIARYIHQHSNRSAKPFISVNCAAIPDSLVESELFGHLKGAFTGALSNRIGKFEQSDGGTLLLDEISEIDIKLQAKLLRAIQEKEIDPIGAKQPIKLDLRIIATSNRNLKAEVDAHRFREDLYFRLNVINIHLPPLIERHEDIIPIANYYLTKYSKDSNIIHKHLSKSTIELLKNHHWPGNIRELENTIHRALLLSTSKMIEPSDLMLDSYSSNQSLSIGKTIHQVEQDLILATLDQYKGNKTHTANVLGISIKTLRNKLNNYNLLSNKLANQQKE